MDVIPVHAMILIMLHRCAILDMSCRLSSKMRYVTKRRVQIEFSSAGGIKYLTNTDQKRMKYLLGVSMHSPHNIIHPCQCKVQMLPASK
jgi:hypothetical protein